MNVVLKMIQNLKIKWEINQYMFLNYRKCSDHIYTAYMLRYFTRFI